MQDSGLMTRWWRLTGVLGALFVVVFIVGGSIEGATPTYDDSIEKIRAYWEDDGDKVLAGEYMIGLGVFFLYLPFLAGLRGVLALAEGGPMIWSRVTFAAGLFAAILAAGAGASWGTLAFGAANLSDDSITTLMYFDVYAFTFFGPAFAIFLFAASLVIWRTGVLWRWLAILGFLLTIVGVLMPLGNFDRESDDIFDVISFAMFIGLSAWMILTGIAMALKKEAPVAAAVD
jgi:hypothetical protein